MKKRLILIFTCFLMCYSLSAQDRSYFSTSYSGQVPDYRTDINLEFIDSYNNFYSLNDISRTVINVIKPEETYYFERFFDNGFITKCISHVHERTTDIYEYDDKNRKLKVGDFSWKYISNNEREEYYQGVKEYNEQTESGKNCFKVTRNELTKNNEDNTFIPSGRKKVLEYFFNDDGNLIEYVEGRWYRKDVKSEYVKKVDFEYDENQKLIKIISGYEGGDIRFITTIEYDEDGNMSELVRKNIRENTSETVRFSRYDFYGNWHNSMTYDNTGELKETVVREIFYN